MSTYTYTLNTIITTEIYESLPNNEIKTGKILYELFEKPYHINTYSDDIWLGSGFTISSEDIGKTIYQIKKEEMVDLPIKYDDFTRLEDAIREGETKAPYNDLFSEVYFSDKEKYDKIKKESREKLSKKFNDYISNNPKFGLID